MPELKRFFTPPIFQDDEEDTRTANVLNTILLSLMMVLALAGFAVLFVFEQKLGSLLVVVVLLATLLISRYLMQRHRIQFASILLVSGMWAGITLLVSLAGGMTSIDAAYYIMITVIAGLLLGTRAAVEVAIVCSLTGLVMVIVEGIGYPLPRIFPVPARAGWLNLTFGLFLATIALNITLRSLHDALALARRQLEERKKAEEALRESEERFRSLVEMTSDRVWETDLNGVYTYASPKARELLGYEPEEVIGKTPFDLMPPDEAKHIGAIFQDIVASQRPFERLENTARHKDGRLVVLETSGVPFFDANGELLGYRGIDRDITERKQVEEALRESEIRYRRLFEGAVLGVFQSTPEGGVITVNPAFARMFGYESPADVIASVKNVATDIFADPQRRSEIMRLMAERPELRTFENLYRRKDGSTFTGNLHVWSVKDADGRLRHLEGFIEDITERKRAEEALRRSEDKFAKAFRTSPDAINISRMSDGQYLEINDGFTAMTGYTPAEVIGKTFLEINIWADPQDRARLAQALREHGEVIGLEAEFRTKDGSIHTGLMSSRLIEVSGEPCVLSITRDITERKQVEAQLERNLRETQVRFEVSQALAGAETEDEVLDVLIQHVSLYPQAPGSIFTFDRTGSELAVILRRSYDPESGVLPVVPLGARLPISRFTVISLLSADWPFVSDDVWADERVDPATRELLRQTGNTGLSAFPLTIGNEWMGCIVVPAKSAGYFDEEKQHLYQTLAEQGAVALRAARLRETIRESQQRLSLLVQQSPLAVIEWNMDLQVLSWNPAAELIFGYTREEALGRHTAGFIEPEEAQSQADQVWQAVLAREGGAHDIHDNVTKDGHRITCEWFYAPLVGADGQVIGITSLVQDITERKRAEMALQESEERYRSLFENSPISLWEEDFSLIKEYFDDLRAMGVTDFRAFFENHPEAVAHCAGLVKVLHVNKATVALMGARDKDELLAGLSKILVDEALVVFREELITLADGGQWFESEEVHRTLSGEERFIVLNLSVAPGYANSLGKVLVSVLDITERKQAEQALRESEEKYSAVVQQAKDGVIIIQDNIFQFVNEAMADMLGYAPGEMENTPFINYVAPESRAMVATRVKARLAGETVPSIYEAKLLRKDGTIIDAELSAGIIQYRGKPATVGIIRDITERKQMEEALRESEQRFRTLAEASFEGIALTERGVFVDLNDQLAHMLGYSRSELIGKPVMEVVAPKSRDLVADAIRSGRLEPYEHLALRKDGTTFPVEACARATQMVGRQLRVTAIRDITERKRTEEALRKSEARYRAVIESQVDLISRYLPNTILTFVNDAYCQFYGKTREELIGHSFLFMIAPEFRELVRKETENLSKDPRPLAGEYLNYRHDGKECWIQWVVQCIVDENDQVVELQAVGRDITERKQAEAEIRRLNEELEQRVVERTAQLEAANKELEAFSYSVSHDLRAPLRAVDGFSRILLEDYLPQLPPEVARYLRIIFENTRQMGRLIEGLLAFSQLSRQPLNKQPISSADLARQAFDSLSSEQEGRQVKISIGELPPCQGDPTLLRQVWVNLLSNALKFTRRREVARIEIGCVERDGEQVYFVKDNGVGFEMRYADKLFGVFQRLHRAEEYEGTGVGLATVQRIIHRHGGRIWAEAEPDKGATFYFTI